MIKIGVLTLSDRASQGIYDDISGKAIQNTLQEFIADEIEFIYRLCNDDLHNIINILQELSDTYQCDLIVTTGGTGPALRDVTPEAMQAVCNKMLPGFGELMRSVSLQKVPTAILSRQSAGIRGKSLIVNLPGKPQSIKECLHAVFPAIPYCIDLIGGAYIHAHNHIQVFRPSSNPPENNIITHINKNNHPQMVDVSQKPQTQRVAQACGKIKMNAQAFMSVIEQTNAKGPVIQTAIIAAIMGAKKTSDLIPMCHPLTISSVECDIKELHEQTAFMLQVTIKHTGNTGVEMEALMAVSIGLLTMYDMLKAMDKEMKIYDIMLLSKSGGKSGNFSQNIPMDKK